MREEAAVGVSGAVTSWRGTGRPLCLEGLPVERRAVQQTLLLPAGRQRTPVGAAVRRVLPADVAQTVTARHRASAGERGEERDRKQRLETKGNPEISTVEKVKNLVLKLKTFSAGPN